MNRLLYRMLVELTGYEWSQRVLNSIARNAQLLMGVGAGSRVGYSGEKVIAATISKCKTEDSSPICVFDVGANKGDFICMVLEQLEGRRLPIVFHAFEPASQTYKSLVQRYGTHGSVILNNLALGKEVGEAKLYSSSEESGLASLTRRRLDHFGIVMESSETVRIQRIDEYCALAGVDQIDFLKMDVEGHELDVLQGSIRMLKEKRIRALSFEFGGCNIDTRTFFQDYWYFLNKHGMSKIFRIAPRGSYVPVNKYTESCEQFRPTNFVAFRST